MKQILIVFTVFFTLNVYADTLKNRAEIDSLIKKIMVHFGKNELNKGFALMKPYLIIPESEFETVKRQFNDQSPMLKNRFGNVIGSELISQDEVGKSLIQVKFIQKYEKHLMGWKFIFYKNKNGWVLNTFRTTDLIDSFFK